MLREEGGGGEVMGMEGSAKRRLDISVLCAGVMCLGSWIAVFFSPCTFSFEFLLFSFQTGRESCV